jgi:hypothetical protein
VSGGAVRTLHLRDDARQSSGGMMGGTWGPGMMDPGWRGADGTLGMRFEFTTI